MDQVNPHCLLQTSKWRSSSTISPAVSAPSASSSERSTPLPLLSEGQDFHVVTRESGTESMCNVYTSPPGVVPLEERGEGHDPVVKEAVPGCPGVFLLSDVLSHAECDRIVQVCESMGFVLDAPVSLSRDVRQNDNVVWIADEGTLNGVIFQRCKAFLPQCVDLKALCAEDDRFLGGGGGQEDGRGTTNGSRHNDETGARNKDHAGQEHQELLVGPPTGLNQRWRVYRYRETDIFRPHTDGSWPGSGLDAEGRLVQDQFPGRQWSMLTFLLYLSEADNGGETNFYYPRVEGPAGAAKGGRSRGGDGGRGERWWSGKQGGSNHFGRFLGGSEADAVEI